MHVKKPPIKPGRLSKKRLIKLALYLLPACCLFAYYGLARKDSFVEHKDLAVYSHLINTNVNPPIKKIAYNPYKNYVYVTPTEEATYKGKKVVPFKVQVTKTFMWQHNALFANRSGFKKIFSSRNYIPLEYTAEIPDLVGALLMALLSSLPSVIMVLFSLFLFSRMSDMFKQGGDNKVVVWDKDNRTRVTFKDVKGMAEAKKQLTDIVNYFKQQDRYRSIGAQPPKGAMLIGPPGTGKTLLAKAVAGEASVPLLSVDGSSFEEVFVGLGARRIRSLFQKARDMAPCIIFIDEIDALAKKRMEAPVAGSSDTNTLNQLLSEIDGFNPTDKVFLLASTNRAKVIDPALMRSGRFGRKIYTNYPTLKERAATFNHYIGKIKTKEKIMVQKLAEQTIQFSYADISEVCYRAAFLAATKYLPGVGMAELQEAISEKIGGTKRVEKILKGQEKKIVAVHEAGHAMVAHCLPHADPLVHLTIIPRTDSTLGFAQYKPTERLIVRKGYLMDAITTALGGRAAEQVIFSEISTGAVSDLEQVTDMVYQLILNYGMGEEVGHLALHDHTGYSQIPYSEDTKRRIDQEAKKIVQAGYEKALAIVERYRAMIHKIADLLGKKEEISGEAFTALVGEKAGYVQQVEQMVSAPQKVIPSLTDSQEVALLKAYLAPGNQAEGRFFTTKSLAKLLQSTFQQQATFSAVTLAKHLTMLGFAKSQGQVADTKRWGYWIKFKQPLPSPNPNNKNEPG